MHVCVAWRGVFVRMCVHVCIVFFNVSTFFAIILAARVWPLWNTRVGKRWCGASAELARVLEAKVCCVPIEHNNESNLHAHHLAEIDDTSIVHSDLRLTHVV